MPLREIEAERNELEKQNAVLLQAIVENEKNLRKYCDMFDYAPVGGVVVGRDGILRAVNYLGAHILGKERDGMVGKRLLEFIPVSARQRFNDFTDSIFRDGRKFHCDMELKGRETPIVIRFEGVCDQVRDECRIAMINLPDRRTPDKRGSAESGDQSQSMELRRSKRIRLPDPVHHRRWDEPTDDSTGLQRKLSNHLMSAREEERTAIAREIHEELGQMLAALQLNLALITQKYIDHSTLVARAKVMEQLIASSITTVQRISSDLRPVMIDILGLADAMEWQAKEFQKKSGIICKTTIHIEEQAIARDVSTAVYRIFQEAMSNVFAHSGASAVQVVLKKRGTWLNLAVYGNGGVIAASGKEDIPFLGIVGLRERVEAFGGRLRISDMLKQGILLFARIPLAAKEDMDVHENTSSR